ncbi:MAG: pyridoxamine 5'-phosphate oxidase family protein [Sedimentisphaerales bacterium]|nr:pyridoxamine 5'-phosphate oxidase family protein [Sedimentisphaerales bacterium]
MKEVIDFLTKSQVFYLATAGLDGKPKVRPFGLVIEEDGKIYFCTSNKKNVYKEMKKQPWVEISACGENFSWVRLSGRAVFSNNLAIKSKVLDLSPFVKSIYKTPDNPIFEIFYLDEASATFYDFSGKTPKTVKL